MKKQLILIFLLVLSVSSSFAAFPINRIDSTTNVTTTYTQKQKQLLTNTNEVSHAVPRQNADKNASVHQGNDKAVAAFGLAVVGLFIAGILFGSLAVIFGAFAVKPGKSLQGFAIAGLFLGIIDVVGAILVLSAM